MMFRTVMDKPREALKQIRIAVEQDPLFPVYRGNFAISLWMAGDDAEALKELYQLLELDENLAPAHVTLAAYHAVHGDQNKALASAEKAYSLDPKIPKMVGTFAGLLSRAGEIGRGREGAR